MKRQLIPVLISALLLLPSCNTVQPPAPESVPESSAPVSSEAVSSEAASSLADSSAPASSEAIPSAAESAAASSLPQSSQEKPPKEVASSTPVSSAPPPVAKKEETKNTDPAPPPASASDESKEQADVQKDNVPEDRRPMTEAEVNATIEEAIAYAEDLGMIIDDTMPIRHYFNPANSTYGRDLFKESLIYHIDQQYHIVVDDPDYDADLYDGCTGIINIVAGPIEDEENAWFGYVLY